MSTKKPEEWGKVLDTCIREGLNHKKTNERLVAELGAEAQVSGAAYGKHKKAINGGPEVGAKLEEIGERLKTQKQETQTPQRPAWTKQKQTQADTSKLAQLLNQGVYSAAMPFCASKKLRLEDVQEINLGGSIVGVITWAVPGVNLDHPIIVLVTRVIMFVLKFRQMCSAIKERMEGGETVGGIVGGLKEEFAETLKD